MHLQTSTVASERQFNKPFMISAIGTPLTEDESLHEAGLNMHVDDQWENGIDGILVGGTMGAMQLLRDDTYQALARRAVEFSRGRGEVMVGAGDCSFARTLQRIEFLNTLRVDGIVVLTPYFLHVTQGELLDYFRALADASRAPLYLYDLPQRTRSKIELPTALALARHPNIHGIKCSDEPTYARELRDAVEPSFRVILAQAAMVDTFFRAGFREHLDGMFAIAPHWSVQILRCAARGEWAAAEQHQRRLNDLRRLVAQHGVLQMMTMLLNARGIPGSFAPRPFRPLESAIRDAVLSTKVVGELLSEKPAAVRELTS